MYIDIFIFRCLVKHSINHLYTSKLVEKDDCNYDAKCWHKHWKNLFHSHIFVFYLLNSRKTITNFVPNKRLWKNLTDGLRSFLNYVGCFAFRDMPLKKLWSNVVSIHIKRITKMNVFFQISVIQLKRIVAWFTGYEKSKKSYIFWNVWII